MIKDLHQMTRLSLNCLLFFMTVSAVKSQDLLQFKGSEYCSQKQINTVHQQSAGVNSLLSPVYKLDVLNYTLNLKLYSCYLAPYPKNFSATNIVQFRVDTALNFITLNSVKISYQHLNVSDNNFYANNGLVFTDCEMEGARYWFPCWDKAVDKATLDLTAMVPASVTIDVSASPPLTVDITAAPTAICKGQSSQLVANPSTASNTYSVIVSDGFGSVSGTTALTANLLPAANAGASRPVCVGASTSIGSAPVAGNSYSWTSVPEGFTSLLQNPEIPNITAMNLVTLTLYETGASESLWLVFNENRPCAPGQDISLPVRLEGPSTLGSCPNPFTDHTTLNYSLPAEGHVMIGFADMTGKFQRILTDSPQTRGTHSIQFDSQSIQPGIYMVTLTLKTGRDELIKTIKLV